MFEVVVDILKYLFDTWLFFPLSMLVFYAAYALIKIAIVKSGLELQSGQLVALQMSVTVSFFVWIAYHPFMLSADTPSEQAVYAPKTIALNRTFKCSEPIPEFSLGPNSNPTAKAVEQLCGCIWSKFPEGGWERRTSALIREGKDPGWRGKGFGYRFGSTLRVCGGEAL